MTTFDHIKQLATDMFSADPIETHPLIDMIARDLLSPQEARAVALQIYHVVDHFPRFLAAMLGNLADVSMRMPLVENLYAEHGRMNLDEVHVHTYRDFLSALGITAEEIDASVPGVGATAYVRAIMDLCGRQSPPEGLAALGVIEECVARVSPIVSNYGQRYQARSADATAHFGLHETLDLEHADELYELAARCYVGPARAEVERGLQLGFYYHRRLYTDLLAEVLSGAALRRAA